MILAFNNNEDIHVQAASKVFDIPLEEVSKEERSKAKAVNFGIVYGISDYGLGEQIGVSRKIAKEYIEQYLDKYSGIKKFMEDIVETAKQEGYVKTLYNRRRYIPEIKSNNHMVRQFGARIAMNTPVQGSSADIIKIAMINVYNKLKSNNLKSKLILQVHDELLIETKEDEKEMVKAILKKEMENVIKLKVPLTADLSEGYSWYDSK
jgi:DNA polymerase-1